MQQCRNMTDEEMESTSFKRKRKNVVRDWMYFIVWYIRLKKILDRHKGIASSISVSQMLKGYPLHPQI